LSLFVAWLLAGCTWTGFGFKASGAEMPRLKEALALRAGMVVADVGAGKGQLTLALAAAVGPDGHVFSTEIDPERLRGLREMVAEAKLGNVTVVEARASESGLPDGCCDAIVLRRVYHHLSDPGAINASLLRALRPNGLLAVIDFPPPPLFSRGSAGVPAQEVVDEVTASGFHLLRLSQDWPGRGPLGSYCALFRKPAPHAGETVPVPQAARVDAPAAMTFVREEGLQSSGRLWIDADAACGHSARTDPDDCLAIALLAHATRTWIAGISTVAGNAPHEVVERTTRELAAHLSAEVGRALPVHIGHQGLMAALEEGPLIVAALGPLTNLAAALDARPELRPRVVRVVAVMGRRPGHIFHPAESAGGGMFFGHGPVFRDFNFQTDVGAAARIVALGVPLTLVPYDAARRIEISEADLDRLAARGGAAAWIAERSRAWLAYWREDIGRQGFFPFDLLAAAYVVEPRWFGCADVQAWIGPDPTLFWRPIAFLVGQSNVRPLKPRAHGSARYCADVSAGIGPWLVDRLAR
jgi:inosine-uridine nucleoside N-ribohydrolase